MAINGGFESQKTYTDKTKWNPAARGDSDGRFETLANHLFSKQWFRVCIKLPKSRDFSKRGFFTASKRF